MTNIIETLTEIRDDLAHSRNAWLTGPSVMLRRAQNKVDVMNLAISLVAGMLEVTKEPQTDPNIIHPGKDPDFVFPEE